MSLKRKAHEKNDVVHSKKKRKKVCYPSDSLLEEIIAGKTDIQLDYFNECHNEYHYSQLVSTFVYPLNVSSLVTDTVTGNDRNIEFCLLLNQRGPKIEKQCPQTCTTTMSYSSFLKSLLISENIKAYINACSKLINALQTIVKAKGDDTNDGINTTAAIESKALSSFKQLLYYQPDLIYGYLVCLLCTTDLQKDDKVTVLLDGVYEHEIYFTTITLIYDKKSLHLCRACIRSISHHCVNLNVTISWKEAGCEIVLFQKNSITTPSSVHFSLSS